MSKHAPMRSARTISRALGIEGKSLRRVYAATPLGRKAWERLKRRFANCSSKWHKDDRVVRNRSQEAGDQRRLRWSCRYPMFHYSQPSHGILLFTSSKKLNSIVTRAGPFSGSGRDFEPMKYLGRRLQRIERVLRPVSRYGAGAAPPVSSRGSPEVAFGRFPLFRRCHFGRNLKSEIAISSFPWIRNPNLPWVKSRSGSAKVSSTFHSLPTSTLCTRRSGVTSICMVKAF
jgi:hypothetical protein